MNRFARFASVGALLAICWSGSAQAELRDDVARLTAGWAKQGIVKRLPPRLAERASPSVVFLPAELLAGASNSCLSVAVLGPSSTHFMVRAAGGSYLPDSPEDWPQGSLAGLVQITRCGARKSRLMALLVEMRSPRAVIEVVAVKSEQPVAPATDVVPERDPGPIAPFTAFAPPPAPPPLAERMARVNARAKRDGAREVTTASVPSSSRGEGAWRAELEPGCYRIDVLAEGGNGENAAADLSILPELAPTSALVGMERGDGYASALGFCVGERASAGLRFVGALPNRPVSVIVARSPLPEGLSESWDSGARAHMAAVLRESAVRVSGSPVDQALGVQGPTVMPIRVEPGACYVAALAAVQGQAFSMALGAESGVMRAQNHRMQGGGGTLLSFCARDRTTATIEADARGTNLSWLFALWQTGRIAVGEDFAP